MYPLSSGGVALRAERDDLPLRLLGVVRTHPGFAEEIAAASRNYPNFVRRDHYGADLPPVSSLTLHKCIEGRGARKLRVDCHNGLKTSLVEAVGNFSRGRLLTWTD
eukprot:TRINITY_DN8712_c0_g1_i3.p2 TRINITY_DN8712_c0_g1~~TRINITY_DN8712_c0_g1_i3.p2  ORF type:complete len:106 (+),score=6.80 TRINITY_DN8712_c0_g1_i3:373-690(+)